MPTLCVSVGLSASTMHKLEQVEGEILRILFLPGGWSLVISHWSLVIGYVSGNQKTRNPKTRNYNSFRNRATGILSCSLYLATVRLAMG